MIFLLALVACRPDPAPAGALECGTGTHLEGTACVADADTAADTGDTATDSGDTSYTDSGNTETGDTAVPTDADGDGSFTPDDCDDADAGVNPGATEVCGNGKDDDCDTTANGCSLVGELDVGDGAFALRGAYANDYSGDSIGGGADLTGDGVADVVVGSASASPRQSGSGLVYVVAGAVSGDLSLSDAAARVVGEDSGLHVGHDVAILQDANGDGDGDLLVGSQTTGGPLGEVWVLYGPLSGDIAASDADLAFTAEKNTDRGGWAVAAAGDTDGDGNSDWMTSASVSNTSHTACCGAVYLWNGGSAASGAMVDASTVIVGSSAAGFGSSLAGLGDVNGDGMDDIAAGGESQNYKGQIWVFHGPLDADITAQDADALLTSSTEASSLAEPVNSLAGGADVDGDGNGDLVAGAFNEGSSSRGAVYIVSGQVSGTVDLASCMARVDGDVDNAYLGYTVAAPGDVDGDGKGDVWLGASGANANGAASGAALLFYGPITGSFDMSDAPYRQNGDAPGDALGFVGSGGDLNADGYADLLAASPVATGDETTSGVAWLTYGGGL